MPNQYRYPGAKPFQTKESFIFYGRENDATELYQLIGLEPLVVLHSKSGIGKSSLINAGLIPKVKTVEEFQSFNIRFFANTKEKAETPLEITFSTISSRSKLLDKIRPKEEDNSLWYYLKSWQLSQPPGQGILLIFDQFEELFTYSEEDVEQFARQLSEALYTTLPQPYCLRRKAEFEKDSQYLNAEELAQLDLPLNLRVLMAIRSDRMSLLKKLKQYLPTILSADYELQPLTKDQAEDAILSPAYNKNNFATPVFDYSDEAIEFLLDYLSESGKETIESFQLQILCEYIERNVVKKSGKTNIEQTDISNPDQILENYYFDKISAISDPEEQLAARKFIEEGLIFEEEERRLSLYEGQIFKTYNVSPTLLRRLIDTHLIRSEPSMRGGYSYELSHDTLVAPVLKAKAKRVEKELREIERLKKEQQRFRRQRLFFVSLAILILTLFLTYQQYLNRELRNQQAIATNALDSLKVEQRRLVEARYNEFLAKAKLSIKSYKYYSALNELETAIVFDSTRQEAFELKKEVEEKLSLEAEFERIISEGDSLKRKGESFYIDALEKYREAEALGFNNPLANEKAADVRERLGSLFERFIIAGDAFFEARGYRYALNAYRQALRIRPNDPSVQRKVKMCLMLLGRD